MKEESLLKSINFDYKLILAWLLGIIMGIDAGELSEWILFILFSLGLWAAFASIERQILCIQKEIECLHKKNGTK